MSLQDDFEKEKGGKPLDLQAEFEKERDVAAIPPEPPSVAEKALSVLEPWAKRANFYGNPVEQVRQVIQDPAAEGERLRSLASGMSLGLAPKLLAKLEGSDPEAARLQYAKAVEEHPIENFAGSMGVPLLGPISEAMGAASLPARIVGRFGLGTAAAGLQGYASAAPGHEKEGALGGMEFGGIGAGLGEGIAAAAPLISRVADNAYLKAAGFIQHNLQKLTPEKQAQVAQVIREEGLVPFRPWGVGKGEVAKRAETTLANRGSEIGNELVAADSARAPLDYDATMASLEAERNRLLPSQRMVMDPQLEGPMADLREAKAKGGGFVEFNRIKSAAQGRANYDPRIDREANDARIQIARTIRESGDAQLEAAEPELAQRLAGARKAYGGAAEVAPVAQRAADREHGNTLLGLVGGTVLGAAGMEGAERMLRHESGGDKSLGAGLMTGLAYAALKRRGPSVAAPVLSGAAQVAPAAATLGAPAGRSLKAWLDAHEADKQKHFLEGQGGD